jgi:hypothetical protein
LHWKWNVLEFISQEDLYLFHLEPCRFGDTTFVVFDPSCEPNSDSLRDRSISFETIASWLEVSTSYREVLRILMPYWASVARPSWEPLLSTTRECLDRPVTPSREGPSGDHETLALVAPFDVPRTLGIYFTVKAFRAGPLEAMMALRSLSVISIPVFGGRCLHVDFRARDGESQAVSRV